MAYEPHPRRIQRSRRKGATHPPGTVFVTRPLTLSNPFVGDDAVAGFQWWASRIVLGGRLAVRQVVNSRGSPQMELTDFNRFGLLQGRTYFAAIVAESMKNRIEGDSYPNDFRAAIHAARGKPIACSCPLDRPCHGDIICELTEVQHAK